VTNFSPQGLSNFLNQFNGTVTPAKKPRFADVPPIWQDKIILGLQENQDIRHFTQIKCWVKPPSSNFPTANVFLSLVNAKGSVFVKLNGISELETLQAALATWIPQIQTKLNEVKPLEAQFAAARAAFDAVLSSSGTDNDEETL